MRATPLTHLSPATPGPKVQPVPPPAAPLPKSPEPELAVVLDALQQMRAMCLRARERDRQFGAYRDAAHGALLAFEDFVASLPPRPPRVDGVEVWDPPADRHCHESYPSTSPLCQNPMKTATKGNFGKEMINTAQFHITSVLQNWQTFYHGVGFPPPKKQNTGKTPTIQAKHKTMGCSTLSEKPPCLVPWLIFLSCCTEVEG